MSGGPARSFLLMDLIIMFVFLDALTKFIWIFPLKFKSDVEPIFLQFQKYVERHFDLKIKAIQTNWGGGSIEVYIIISNHVGFNIVYHVLIHMNKWVLLNVDIVKLLRWA